MLEMDNNDNPIIQSLEALLGGEEMAETAAEKKFNSSFEEMRARFKDSFILDQSKDSGITFSAGSISQSFSQHLRSKNTSMQSQSIDESGFASESFDTPFHLKPLVKNVSFDGCFVEDDNNIIPSDLKSVSGDFDFKYPASAWNTAPHSAGILSSAVSKGGDIGKSLQTTNTQQAYNMVKYIYVMKKCWNTISCISKLRCQLTKKPMDSSGYSMEWNLMNLLDAFKNELLQVAEDAKNPRLIPIVIDLQIALELVYTNVGSKVIDIRLLKQLQSLINNLFVALYSQCILQNSLSTPSEDRFRSEKRFQIWNSLI